ncbi:MAG: electron transfer flavoprotein subunit beta/FixA family protein [Firmicutes bacterium]|nr:electron transfer flavoprotein subunit beta/FixA family protein [Bacillota bacterium]MDD4263621.1 electron transfer flavoprotein subunit beta/FixA family protein [Bacillota bacterium]MDD4693255.1 electron transfer flavoprotein subunit beta/FixA family protein [Bacillota bacterium]
MRIIVCIKQVPDTTEVAIDEKKGVLKREGVDSRLNPYDLYALETALRIKAEKGAEVIVISMGPMQAEAVIKEAYYMGADSGILLSDRKFAGADTLATAYTLAQGIKKIGSFDLVITGQQTTDGDTAQVGPAVAEFLGLPHICYVTGIKDVSPNSLTVVTDMLDTLETQSLQLPALLTVARDIYQPRLISYRLKLSSKDREITVLNYNDLSQNQGSAALEDEYFGLSSSPTQVERIFPPSSVISREILEENPHILVKKTILKLKELKII